MVFMAPKANTTNEKERSCPFDFDWESMSKPRKWTHYVDLSQSDLIKSQDIQRHHVVRKLLARQLFMDTGGSFAEASVVAGDH
ncbi:hypothetical protein QTG54_004287 [Skeletonema marinoi]|uniref:Uncharacterized protein n=1 Tax=Skeletonema marinoi TaxID=267567 RepID=A0AAD8YEF2_9STRA|nr:hypothetical protein QTG54_004287 [Skeletonema marinoi]